MPKGLVFFPHPPLPSSSSQPKRTFLIPLSNFLKNSLEHFNNIWFPHLHTLFLLTMRIPFSSLALGIIPLLSHLAAAAQHDTGNSAPSPDSPNQQPNDDLAAADSLTDTLGTPISKASPFWKLDDSISNLFSAPPGQCLSGLAQQSDADELNDCLQSVKSKALQCGSGDSTCLCQVLVETRATCYKSCSGVYVKSRQQDKTVSTEYILLTSLLLFSLSSVS